MSLSIQKHYLAGFIIAFMLFTCIGNESVAQSSLIEIPRIPFLSQDGLEDRGGVPSSLEILFFL